MDVDKLIALLSQVPFAILVAAYVLIRIEPILQRLAATEAAELELLRVLADYLLPPGKIPAALRSKNE